MIRLCFALLVALQVGPAFAQSAKGQLDIQAYLLSRLGTISVKGYPQFSDGKLYACIVEFSSLVQDWTYSKGRLIRVGGSFGFMTAQNAIGISLKVIVHDMDSKTLALTPSPPDSAYLISGTKTSKAAFVGKYPSDTPGALFSIFRMDGAFELLIDAIQQEKITIGFNRRAGGMDILVPLDLTVEDTDANGKKTISHHATRNFISCTKDLIESVK